MIVFVITVRYSWLTPQVRWFTKQRELQSPSFHSIYCRNTSPVRRSIEREREKKIARNEIEERKILIIFPLPPSYFMCGVVGEGVCVCVCGGGLGGLERRVGKVLLLCISVEQPLWKGLLNAESWKTLLSSISKEPVVLIFTFKCTCVELIASTNEKKKWNEGWRRYMYRKNYKYISLSMYIYIFIYVYIYIHVYSFVYLSILYVCVFLSDIRWDGRFE